LSAPFVKIYAFIFNNPLSKKVGGNRPPILLSGYVFANTFCNWPLLVSYFENSSLKLLLI